MAASDFTLCRGDPQVAWGLVVDADAIVSSVEADSPVANARLPLGARITHTNGATTLTGSAFAAAAAAPALQLRVTAVLPRAGVRPAPSASPVDRRVVQFVDGLERERWKEYTMRRHDGAELWGFTLDTGRRVMSVVPSGPADSAGVIAGVRISTVGGAACSSGEEVVRALASRGLEEIRIGAQVPASLAPAQEARDIALVVSVSSAEKDATARGAAAATSPAAGDALAGADVNDCAVCISSPRNVYFRPCGHVCVCSACAAQLAQCPVCRGAVAERLPAFL